MKSWKPAALAAAVALSLVPSCAAPDLNPEHVDATNQETKAAVAKRGPTLTLDHQARLADPTTLQLLEERSTELAKAKKRVEELETELKQRGQDLERAKNDSSAKTREKEQLEGLLKDATENERVASEKALSAEIARLKYEQEVLRMKLGNMIKDH
jgi:chromosome segregation ATPase